jgi:thymidine kinase
MRWTPERGGWLEVIFGPMFSGKSEELLRRLRRAEIARQRVVLVKPRVDDRYGVARVVSHGGTRMRAVAVTSPYELMRVADGFDVVGIDEVQFFDESIVAVVERLVASGRRVVAAGLDTDFRHRPFGSVPTLVCIAERVDKLQAVCERCGGAATRTQRLSDDVTAPFGGATIQVGGGELYEARCAACYESGVERAIASEAAGA